MANYALAVALHLKRHELLPALDGLHCHTDKRFRFPSTRFDIRFLRSKRRGARVGGRPDQGPSTRVMLIARGLNASSCEVGSMTGRRLRAFVSSRMGELSAERAAIKSALDQLLVDAWVFEADAGARPESIQQTYLKEVEDADFYIGVFWRGYGQYTIDEYEHARQCGKDCFIYEKRADLDGRDSALSAFLKRIGGTTTGLTIHRFDDIQQIGGFVVEDVARWQADVIRRRASRRSTRVFQAPPLSDQYVERTGLLRQCLDAALGVDEHGLRRVSRLALQGGGGAGKSVMAAALAAHEEVQSRFEDGVLWVSLGKTPNLKETLSGWGLALHDPAMPDTGYADPTTATNQLRTLLQDRACLIVADDVWDADHVNPAMLVGGPRCALLITTRDAAIADRLKATTVSLDVMTEVESLALLTRWTGELNEAESATVATRLAREVGYLPLALELIGAQVRRLKSWERFQRRWDAKRLESLRRDRDAHGPDNSLQDSINLSLEALSNDDRKRYVDLGIFPLTGSFTSGAAAALWSLDEDDATELLEELAGRALLTRREQEGRDRFSFHSLLHAVAVEQLGVEGNRTAQQRLLTGYRRKCINGWASGPDDGYFFEGLSYHLASSGTPADLYSLVEQRWMAAQYARSFSHRSFAKDVETALSVARAAIPLDLASVYRCSLVVSTLGLLSLRVPPALMGVLVRLGDRKRAHAVAASIGDPASRAQAWRSMAEALLPDGPLHDAAEMLVEAQAAAITIATPETRVEELVNIAGLLERLHDTAGARRAAALAVASWPQIAVPALRARLTPALASVFVDIGDRNAAASLAERLLQDAESAVDQSSMWVIGPLAHVAQVCGALDLLRRVEETALRLRAQGMGDDYVPGMTAAFFRLGCTTDAKRVASSCPGGYRRAEAFAALATAQIDRGDMTEALDALDEAVSTVQRDESARTLDVVERLLRLSATAGRSDYQARIVACMNDTPGISRARELAVQALAAVQHGAAPAAAEVAASRTVTAIREIVASDPSPWLEDLTGAVSLLGEAGLFEAATRGASLINDPSGRNEALASIAQAMIDRGDVTGAREKALAILTARPEVDAGLPSVKALTAVALALSASGELALARRTVARLAPAAAAVKDGPGRTGSEEALATVARVAHRLGEHEIAIDCARKALGSVGTQKWLWHETSTLLVFGAAAEVLDDPECEQALSVAQAQEALARAAVAEITEGLMRRGRDRRAAEFVAMLRANAVPAATWNQADTCEAFVELARLADPAAVAWVATKSSHLRAHAQRALALGTVAATWWRMDQHGDAERVLLDAMNAAAGLPDDDRARVLVKVAREFADASAPQRTVDVGRQALSYGAEPVAVGPVVGALAGVGHANAALTLALEVEAGRDRDNVIGGILCQRLLERGDVGSVLSVASGHLSQWGVAYWDARVAMHLAQTGDMPRARERARAAAGALQSISYEPGKSMLQALLARACATMGEAAEAREWAETAAGNTDDEPGLLIQSWLASAMTDAGDRALAKRYARRAVAIADGLTDPWSLFRNLDDLASAALGSGAIEPDELIALVGRLGDQWARASTLAAVYSHVPREKATAILTRIGELTDQSAMGRALGELATLMAKAGDHDGLLLTLEAEGALKWTWAGGAALGRIAAAAAAAGMTDVLSRGLAALRDYTTPTWSCIGGLAMVARAFSGLQDADEFQNLVRQALDQAGRSHDLEESRLAVNTARLGLALMHLKDRDGAVALADDAHGSLPRIQWYWRRHVMNGLLPLAAALGEPARIEQLLPFVEPTAGEGPVAELRADWALALARSGDVNRARTEANQVTNIESASPSALGAAAAALFFAGPRDRALEVAADAMMKARLTSRDDLAGVLEAVAPALGHMNERELLIQIEGIDRAVSGWWDVGDSIAAPASHDASGTA